MTTLRRACLLPVLIFLVSNFCEAQNSPPKTRVAVVEFKVDGDMGLEKSGEIIAEWMVAEFVRLGKYDVMERLSMKAILEEQGFQQSEAVADSTAVKAGRIRGAEGIVTGSVIKLGSAITVTGRMIAVETGKVLKSSVVRASSIDALPKEIEVLANQLCDISREEFEIRRDAELRSASLLAVGGGPGIGTSSNGGFFEDQKSLGLALNVSFTSAWFAFWIQGIPLGRITSLHVGASVDLSQFWGLAGEAGFVSDDAIDYVSATYIAAGVKFRPRHELQLKVMFGGSLSGTLWFWSDNHPLGPKENVKGYLKLWPPATFSVELNYRPLSDVILTAKFAATTLNGYTLKHVDVLGNIYECRVILLMVQKEFAISY